MVPEVFHVVPAGNNAPLHRTPDRCWINPATIFNGITKALIVIDMGSYMSADI